MSKPTHWAMQLVALVFLTGVVVLVTADDVQAQQLTLSQESYLMPPKEIADAVLAARHENVTLNNLSPDGKKFLITKSDGMPTLARLARPCVYLGEMAFDPVACRSRQLWLRSSAGFDLYFHADKRTVPVQVPPKARVSDPVWSPDGSKLAFFAHFDDATHIYLACTETGTSRRLTTTPVLATMVATFQWSSDGKQIQTVLLPDDGKREMPRRADVASEPKVRVARDGNNPSRTYRFLLESPHDMRLFEHLVTGQLALINVNDGKVTKVGFPNLIKAVSMCPGAEQFRVSTIKKPFSYYVPAARFGSIEGIWSLEGKQLYTLADRKLQETEPQPQTPPTVAAAPAGAFKGKTKGAKGPAPQTDPNPNPDNPADAAAQAADAEGRRDLRWRPDGIGLSYLQLEPLKTSTTPQVAGSESDDFEQGKAESKTPAGQSTSRPARRDRVMQWLPPFGPADAKVVYETPYPIISVQYAQDCRTLFLTQTIDSQRQIVAVDLADPKSTFVIYKGAAAPAGKGGATDPNAKKDGASLDDDDWAARPNEQKKGPGGFGGFAGLGGAGGPTLMARAGRGEGNVVRMSRAGEVYLTGTDRRTGAGASARPYIEKVHVKTGKKTRIFEGQGEATESIDAVDSDDIQLVFTTRQKSEVVPDSYMTDLKTGKSTKLTKNVDHTPWHHQLKVERFQATRVDGFKFWVKVTTPPKHAGKLPALFWIYPREYTDQAAYDRAAPARGLGTGGGRFNAPGPRSMTLLCLLGYAVVEPDIPIVGPAGRMNDNYIPDLRNGLWAVIDELDKRGIIDRDRLAIGGHSYGAFSTANAMAHTPFFKAGIAGDGNYNRTLTSMSFQTERRQLWDARETYLEMSPLLWANRVNGALLMYHGMDDANVGTNPINAEFMFMALDGLGKPAALYMYPYEGHGPIGRETTLDMWARWVAWLDTYVKSPQQQRGKETSGKKGAAGS